MEGVLLINGQAADLGALHDRGSRDVASLLVISEEGERDHVGRGMLDGVPFEDHGGLGCVSTAEDWRLGLGSSKGVVDGILEGGEVCLRFLLGIKVARDGDVYYAPRGDIGREENGGEFDLWKE